MSKATKFKPISAQLFQAVTDYYLSGQSISANYKIGTLTQIEDSEEFQFEELLTKSFWIDEYNSQELINAPMTKEDIGKTPNEIMLSRIETYLRSTGEIKL